MEMPSTVATPSLSDRLFGVLDTAINSVTQLKLFDMQADLVKAGVNQDILLATPTTTASTQVGFLGLADGVDPDDTAVQLAFGAAILIGGFLLAKRLL